MRLLIGVAMAIGLSTPAFAVQKVAVDVPPPVALSPLPPAAARQSVLLARAAGNMRLGTPWAELQVGMLCQTVQTLAWEAKNNVIGPDLGFDRAFREELGGAGFKVAGDPTNLFEADNHAADLQVGALINDLRLRACDGAMPLTGAVIFKGAATMDVEWQVYSVSQGKIVARIATHGGYQVPKFTEKQNIGHLIGGAFADSLRRLAADEQFRSLVAGAAEAPRQTFSEMTMQVPAPAAISLAQAAKGVVSIFSGDAMGSGVLVSSDGYILTNHHVAGSTGQVRIHWPDGTDGVGEVVRADRKRDVALIKTVAKAQAVPIRHAPVALGETVFAIGTPLDKRLEGTLTRGVVSTASRMYEGQPFIQSDVGVAHGNSGGPLLDEKGAVIGLTDLGLYADESKSLNLFIPIDDALRALALKPAG